MHVVMPSVLDSYTGGRRNVEGSGESIAQLLDFLDASYPGVRHRIVDEQDRIRRHMRFFVNGEMAKTVDRRLRADDEVLIVAALSGG